MIATSKDSPPSQRIALYGGAFNPIHNGHLATIGLLLASQEFDKVVVVPSGDRPDKKIRVSAADRLQMTEIAVSEAFPGESRVEVSDLHARGRVGYGTVDLVEYFRAQACTECCVVIGHELLPDIPSWKESERLCSIAHFLVIHRPGSPITELPAGITGTLFQPAYSAGVLISSSTIRGLMAQGLSCAGLLPPSVIAFCRERGLYTP